MLATQHCPGVCVCVQVTAAVHAKLLRLNSASVSAVSAGQIVNLVSNDARRFDDYSPHVPFLVLAPIELGMVSVGAEGLPVCMIMYRVYQYRSAPSSPSTGRRCCQSFF